MSWPQSLVDKVDRVMTVTERRRFPRWRSQGARAFLYVAGERTRRCNVRSVSKVGLFIETDLFLPKGLSVELAFTQLYTQQVVKLYRRSGFVTRVSPDGVAVLFHEKRAIQDAISV